jgi:hypothetical protein
MSGNDNLPKCVGCGRPTAINPKDPTVAPMAKQVLTECRCQTCYDVGDLFTGALHRAVADIKKEESQ